jgi:hypothetical protein
MNKIFAIALSAFLALSGSMALGQAPDFAGTWAGAMVTDAGPGGFEITLTRDMNRPGIDNRQLALNIVHWLSGLLS